MDNYPKIRYDRPGSTNKMMKDLYSHILHRHNLKKQSEAKNQRKKQEMENEKSSMKMNRKSSFLFLIDMNLKNILTELVSQSIESSATYSQSQRENFPGKDELDLISKSIVNAHGKKSERKGRIKSKSWDRPPQTEDPENISTANAQTNEPKPKPKQNEYGRASVNVYSQSIYKNSVRRQSSMMNFYTGSLGLKDANSRKSIQGSNNNGHPIKINEVQGPKLVGPDFVKETEEERFESALSELKTRIGFRPKLLGNGMTREDSIKKNLDQNGREAEMILRRKSIETEQFGGKVKKLGAGMASELNIKESLIILFFKDALRRKTSVELPLFLRSKKPTKTELLNEEGKKTSNLLGFPGTLQDLSRPSSNSSISSKKSRRHCDEKNECLTVFEIDDNRSERVSYSNKPHQKSLSNATKKEVFNRKEGVIFTIFSKKSSVVSKSVNRFNTQKGLRTPIASARLNEEPGSYCKVEGLKDYVFKTQSSAKNQEKKDKRSHPRGSSKAFEIDLKRSVASILKRRDKGATDQRQSASFREKKKEDEVLLVYSGAMEPFLKKEKKGEHAFLKFKAMKTSKSIGEFKLMKGGLFRSTAGSLASSNVTKKSGLKTRNWGSEFQKKNGHASSFKITKSSKKD